MKKQLVKRKDTARVKAMEKASQFHRAFTMTTQLEDWLRIQAYHGNRVEFKFDVRQDAVNVTFSAFPLLSDDTCSPVDTYEGYCMRYNIEPKAAIDNMMKFFREKPIRERIIPAPQEAVEHSATPSLKD